MSAKFPQATTPRIKTFPYYALVVYVHPLTVPIRSRSIPAVPSPSSIPSAPPSPLSLLVFPLPLPFVQFTVPTPTRIRRTVPSGARRPVRRSPQRLRVVGRRRCCHHSGPRFPAEVVSSYPSYCSPWCAASGSAGPLRDSKWLAAGDAATTQGRGSRLKSCRRIHRTASRGARRPAALVPSETPSGWPQAMLPPLRGRSQAQRSPAVAPPVPCCRPLTC